MGAKSKIEWTEATWNAIRGCSREMAEGATQSGCGDATGGGCYAERDGGRFCGPGLPYEGLVRLTATGPRWTGRVDVIGKHLCDPLRWKTPRDIFVASVSDPYHPKLSNEVIAGLYGIMLLAKWHRFQQLTKRARRMREWYEWAGKLTVPDLIGMAYDLVKATSPHPGADLALLRKHDSNLGGYTWPLSNLLVGVSTEHQAAVDDRVEHLQQVPAALRWLSVEPMIGEVDLSDHLSYCGKLDKYGISRANGRHVICDALCGISWIVLGCESGPRARDCNPEWIRKVIRQCREAGVPVFLKQAKGWDEGRTHIVPMGVGFGPGSHMKKDGVIGAPYFDGEQVLERPVFK